MLRTLGLAVLGFIFGIILFKLLKDEEDGVEVLSTYPLEESLLG